MEYTAAFKVTAGGKTYDCVAKHSGGRILSLRVYSEGKVSPEKEMSWSIPDEHYDVCYNAALEQAEQTLNRDTMEMYK